MAQKLYGLFFAQEGDRLERLQPQVERLVRVLDVEPDLVLAQHLAPLPGRRRPGSRIAKNALDASRACSRVPRTGPLPSASSELTLLSVRSAS